MTCPCGCAHSFDINPAALLASATSDAKKAACVANSKRPRPNAKGKKKPRKTPVSIVKEPLI